MKNFILVFFSIFSLTPLFAHNYYDFVDALFYEKAGDYKKSFDIVSNINKQENDPFLYKYLFDISSKNGMIKESEEISKKLVEIDSTTSDNWLMYANSLVVQNKIKEAKAAYKKAIELDPDNVDAYYQLAVITVDNPDESIGYLKKIIEIDPSFKSDAYYNIAVIYSSKKDEKKMLEYIDLAIKADKYNPKPYYFLALYWENKNNFNKTIEAYNNILNVEPTNSEVTNRLGELYISTKAYDRAEEYFLKTVEINPEDTKALWWLSILNENKKNYAEAKSYLSKINKWQDDVDMVLKMSYYNIMIGNMDETIRILNDAHNKWPDNPDISYYLALGYMDNGDDKSARNYFEIVISTKPDFYEARYNLGVICERLNDVDCFERHFRYLLLKNPNDASVLNYLGYSLVDRGIKLEEATAMIEKAVSLSPEDPAYLDSLAWAYYKKGDYDKAYSYIKKSLDLIRKRSGDPDPLIYEHEGDILLKMNNIGDAYQSYWATAVLGPKNFDELNKKAMSIVYKINYGDLLSNLMLNNPEKRFTATFDAEFNYSYKKLFKKKNIKFTFNGVMFINPNYKYMNFELLSPLFTPILSFEASNKNYNIKTDISDKRIPNEILERYATDILLAIKWYTTSSFYKDYERNMKVIEYNNGCYYYHSVFKSSDTVELCMKNNAFAIDYLKYTSDTSFVINFSDFRPVAGRYSSSDNTYIPYRYQINIDDIRVNLKTKTIDIKYDY